MTLIILSVVVIALFIAVLAIFLFTIGALLRRTADNLGDCVQSAKTVVGQVAVIGPGIKRINTTGGTVVGALPLLCEAAESIAVAKSAPYADPSDPPRVPSDPPRVPSDPPRVPSDPSTVPSRGVGYLDEGGLGYLDA